MQIKEKKTLTLSKSLFTSLKKKHTQNIIQVIYHSVNKDNLEQKLLKSNILNLHTGDRTVNELKYTWAGAVVPWIWKSKISKHCKGVKSISNRLKITFPRTLYVKQEITKNALEQFHFLSNLTKHTTYYTLYRHVIYIYKGFQRRNFKRQQDVFTTRWPGLNYSNKKLLMLIGTDGYSSTLSLLPKVQWCRKASKALHKSIVGVIQKKKWFLTTSSSHSRKVRLKLCCPKPFIHNLECKTRACKPYKKYFQVLTPNNLHMGEYLKKSSRATNTTDSSIPSANRRQKTIPKKEKQTIPVHPDGWK